MLTFVGLGWLTNKHVWWRHPIARIAVILLLFVEDMFMYGEDPLNDSHVLYNVPGMGHALGLITLHTAPSPGLAFLKLFLAIVFIALGAYAGRTWIADRLLHQRLKIGAFEGNEGALFVATLMSMVMLIPAALIYNILQSQDKLDGTSNEIFLLLGARTLQYRHVNQCWQTLSIWVDFLAIIALIDVIFQDYVHYPRFALRFKHVWTKSYNGRVRVGAAWAFILCCCVVGAFAIFSTGKGEDDLGMHQNGLYWFGTSERGRALIAALIVFTDLFVTVQDWDFPSFQQPMDIAAPTFVVGTRATKLRITWLSEALHLVPLNSCQDAWYWRWLPPADSFKLTISGKWLQFGPLVGVMLIDLLYEKSQVLYEPQNYGQYADPVNGSIWAIVDEDYLTLAYEKGILVNASLISYTARRNLSTGAPLSPSAETDFMLNSCYIGTNEKYLGVSLSFIFIVGFVFLLRYADWSSVDSQQQTVTNQPEHQNHQDNELAARREENENESGVDGNATPILKSEQLMKVGRGETGLQQVNGITFSLEDGLTQNFHDSPTAPPLWVHLTRRDHSIMCCADSNLMKPTVSMMTVVPAAGDRQVPGVDAGDVMLPASEVLGTSSME